MARSRASRARRAAGWVHGMGGTQRTRKPETPKTRNTEKQKAINLAVLVEGLPDEHVRGATRQTEVEGEQVAGAMLSAGQGKGLATGRR